MKWIDRFGMIKIRELEGNSNYDVIVFKTLINETKHVSDVYDKLVNKYNLHDYMMLKKVSFVDSWAVYRDWVKRLVNKKYTITTVTGLTFEINIKLIVDTNGVTCLVIDKLPEQFKNQRFVNQQLEILLVKELVEDAWYVRELLTSALTESMGGE